MQGEKAVSPWSREGGAGDLRGPWDNPGDLPGYCRSMRRASKVKFMCRVTFFLCAVWVCWWEKQRLLRRIASRRAKKGVTAAGLVCDAHTQARTYAQAELHLSSCRPAVLCCTAAVLCERSIGPLCSGLHGKQGPVGRCVARPRHVASCYADQPSREAVRSRSEL